MPNAKSESTVESYVYAIDLLLENAKKNGMDIEQIVVALCAKHLMSDESDFGHLYGITFIRKLEEALMKLAPGDEQ